MSKIDLTLATELISQLNKQLELAYKLKLVKTEGIDAAYTVELAKALGLLSTLKIETDLLTADLTRLIKASTFPVGTKAEDDLLSQLFGGTKPLKMS